MARPPRPSLFDERINRVAETASDQSSFSLFYIDLDEFKSVNDDLGHDVGDELSRQVAGRFRGRLRDFDLVARRTGTSELEGAAQAG
ncbi:MAG: diguanylate cyclase [Solirubrobacterales bacterium]